MNRNMAEHSKGGILTKSLKKLNRTKTKVLQNLGKAEKTSDERLDEHVHKLERQQDVAIRFQKELRNYINCAKAMQTASKTFYATLIDTYEQEWKDETIMRESLQQLEIMWMDYVQKLQEQVQNPLTAYITHMPPLKTRISKRGRKLVDFDNTRHNLDVLQNAKKKDEAKIHKAEEELEESKKIYEDLNNELHTDLPDFYNSRVNFYASTFRNLFSTENIFHGELGKLTDTMNNISEKLAKETESDVYNPRPVSKLYAASEGNSDSVVNGHPEPSDHHGNSGYESGTGTDSPIRTPTSAMNGINGDMANDSSDTDHHNTSQDDSPVYENSISLSQQKDDKKETVTEEQSETSSSSQKEDEPKKDIQTKETKLNGDMDDKDGEGVPDYPPPQPPAEEPAYSLATKVKTPTQDDEYTMPYYDKVPDGAHKNMVQKVDEKDDEEDDDDDNVYEVPKSNKPVNEESKEEIKEPTVSEPEPESEPEVLPSGTLYAVKATHPYKGEDVDELSFEAGEIIYVTKFENPDDQDDGWLMGTKKSDSKKGVFPENFTKPISGDTKSIG